MLWNWLESISTIFMSLGTFVLIGAGAGALEFGAITPVFLIFAGAGLLMLILSIPLSYIGSKLHDKWIKETYPEQWIINQLFK